MIAGGCDLIDKMCRGEWGKLSHQVSCATPSTQPKKAEEKMFMYSIVWSYSKDLLHHAALKIHLVVGKFQGKNDFIVFLVLKKRKILFLPSYA